MCDLYINCKYRIEIEYSSKVEKKTLLLLTENGYFNYTQPLHNSYLYNILPVKAIAVV